MSLCTWWLVLTWARLNYSLAPLHLPSSLVRHQIMNGMDTLAEHARFNYRPRMQEAVGSAWSACFQLTWWSYCLHIHAHALCTPPKKNYLSIYREPNKSTPDWLLKVTCWGEGKRRTLQQIGGLPEVLNLIKQRPDGICECCEGMIIIGASREIVGCQTVQGLKSAVTVHIQLKDWGPAEEPREMFFSKQRRQRNPTAGQLEIS